MYIKNIIIQIVPASNEGDKEPKVFELVDSCEWNSTGTMYPKDIRLMSAIDAMVRQYNEGQKKQ